MIIEVTDAAKKRLDKILDRENKEKMLKIYISGRSWASKTFGLVLEEPKEGEFRLEAEGYEFLIEEGLEKIYPKFIVDLQVKGNGERFTVTADILNPNMKR